MAVNFPNSPTNGQTVTVDGVTYSWNAAGSVWDIVTTATATVAVTAPVTNTGTSTAAVLGFATNPSLSGVVSTNGGYKIDSSSQYKAYEYFNNGTRRAVLYTEETQQQLVIQNEGTGPLVIQNGGSTKLLIANNGHITMSAQPFFYARGGETNWVSTSSGDAPFNIAVHNRGSVFNTSNYRFTAPVTGVYNITFSLFANGGSATRLAIKVNGGAYHSSQNTYSPTGFTTWSGNMYLNANDYVTVGDWQGFTNAAVYMGHSHFSGYLLG
jgi:hypothetical protein